MRIFYMVSEILDQVIQTSFNEMLPPPGTVAMTPLGEWSNIRQELVLISKVT
jgi:hypothetical protein